MYIQKVVISNFKGYKSFNIEFTDNVNIIVGNNNEGKTTLFEAIHLALTGTLNGKNMLAEPSANIFNSETVRQYLQDVVSNKTATPPTAFIEVYFTDEVKNPRYEGNNCSDNSGKAGKVGVKIVFELNPDCVDEYNEYISHKEDIASLPIEYYHCAWYAFSDNAVVRTSIPVQSSYIDISTAKYLSGPDKQVMQIVENALSQIERTNLMLAYRKLKEKFQNERGISELNIKLSEIYKDITGQKLSLNIEMASKSRWEENFTTYFDDIPFSQIGKGEQSAFKIKLALSSQGDKPNLVLIEEPENHLSHSNLAVLIDDILKIHGKSQVIISTHSAYVLNRLSLNRVILLQHKNNIMLSNLSEDTVRYFKKLPGYDTLRLILANKAILVEGPSDELIIQKLYLQKYGKLPISNGIDVIAVRGLSFARFLEIAKNLQTDVIVITDNDGKSEIKQEKFKSHLSEHIWLAMSCDDELFTMEKILLHCNGKDKLNDILGQQFDNDAQLLEYMIENKTECALKIFESETEISYIAEVYDAL